MAFTASNMRTPAAFLTVCLLVLHPLHAASEEASPVETKPTASETATPSATVDNKPSNSANQGATNGNYSGANASSVSAINADEVSEITYDQRQNGSQNVRIHLDDVTLIVAPSDGILSLFAAQNQAAQNTETGTPAQAQVSDAYAEFDELISSANFLKSQQIQHGVGQHAYAQAATGGKVKKCTGDRCKAKR